MSHSYHSTAFVWQKLPFVPHKLIRVVQMLLKMWKHPVITTDTSEKGLEDLIVAAMTGDRTSAPLPRLGTGETSIPFGGTGWILGNWHDYDRE